MAPHYSTLAWKIPWTEEPVRLQSMGSLRVGQDWATSLSLFTFMHWRRKWQPTPVLLLGKSHGWRSLVGCSPWDREELDMTEHFHFSLSCIGEGNGNPPQCSCLENPRDGGAWRAAIYGVAQSRTWLKRLSSSSSKSLEKEMATHSSVLAWRIPGTGEPGGLPSVGSHRVKHDWSDLAAAAASLENIHQLVYIQNWRNRKQFFLVMRTLRI